MNQSHEALKETSLAEYLYSRTQMGHKISTNDPLLYKSIRTHTDHRLIELGAGENSLEAIISEYIISTPKYKPELRFQKQNGTICCATHIMQFISNHPRSLYMIEDGRVRDTLRAIHAPQEEDLVLSAAKLLFDPNYASSTPYALKTNVYSEKNNIIKQIAAIIPTGFSYLLPYKKDYLVDLHNQFMTSIGHRTDWDSKDLPDQLNAYQYIDRLSKHFKNNNKPVNEVERIEELLWTPAEMLYLHLADRTSLDKCLPYLQAVPLKQIVVTFADQSDDCDTCPKENLLKCNIKSPCPPLEMRGNTLSISDIAKLRTNPMSYYLESVLEIKQLNFTQNHIIGMIIHNALEQSIQIAAKSKEDLHESIQACISRHPLTKISKAIVSRKINQMLDHLWPLIENAEQVYSEVEGVQNIIKGGKEYKLHGRADLIYKTSTGEYGVIDFKSGTVPSWVKIENGCAPQGPLEALLLASGAFIPEPNIRLAPCGLLSPKGFFKIEPNAATSAQQINTLLELYWVEQKPYEEHVVNRYPVYAREWERYG